MFGCKLRIIGIYGAAGKIDASPIFVTPILVPKLVIVTLNEDTVVLPTPVVVVTPVPNVTTCDGNKLACKLVNVLV